MNTFYHWLAWRLPKRLVYCCTIRLWSQGTGSKYPKTYSTNVRVITVLRRWEESAK